MNDDLLLRYLRKRTTRRFTALVRARRDDVLNAAYRVLGDRDLAEDVTQEVFLKLLTVRWEPRQIRSGRALLMALTVRTAISRIRSEARRSRRELQAARKDPTEPEAMPLDHLLDVRDAVLKLPNDLRACVELRYFGEMTLAEVSSALDVGVTTVKERLRQARETLRASLAPLATVLLATALSEDASTPLPRIQPSPRLEQALEGLAKQGPIAAAAAAGTLPHPGTKFLFPLAAGILLAGIAVVVLVRRPAEPVREAAAPAAPVRAPTIVVAAAASAPAGPVDKAPEETLAPQPEARRPYHVVDERGQPIEGVEVAIVRWLNGPKLDWKPGEGDVVETEGSYHWVITTQTDAAGGFGFPDAAFDLEALKDDRIGNWTFARKESYYDYERVLNARPLEGFSIELKKAAEAKVRVVEGPKDTPVRRYQLEIGLPVDHTVTKLGPLRRASRDAAVDDVSGSFAFLPTCDGWASAIRVTLSDGTILLGKEYVGQDTYADNSLVLRVTRPRQLLGIVEDGAGTPVAGADVYACDYQQPLEAWPPDWHLPNKMRLGASKVLTGTDGSFRIDALLHGTWFVALQGKRVPALLHVPSGPSGEPLRLIVDRGGSVRIECFDAEDAPRKDVEISLLFVGLENEPPELPGPVNAFSLPFSAGPRGFRVKTNENGLALVEDLPPGYYIWLQRRRLQIEVKAGEMTQVFDRDPLPDPPDGPPGGARVHGRITIGGKPVAGQVFIAHQNVRPDADGRYEIDRVPPGIHFIQSPNNYPGLPGTNSMIRFDLSPADKDLQLDWDFPLCALRGRVVAGGAAEIEAKPSIAIWMKTGDHTQLRRSAPYKVADVPCDSSGAFSFANLTSGEYFIVARAKGFAIEVRELDVKKDSPPTRELEIHLSESRAGFNLKLVDASTGAVLSPRLFSFAGRGAELQIYPDNYPGVNDDDLEWSGLPPGVYDYGVSADSSKGFGFTYGSVEIRAGSGIVEHRAAIPPGGNLLVSVEDAAGRRFAEPPPMVELRRADGGPAAAPICIYAPGDPRVHRARAEAPGNVWFPGLPVGAYEVTASRRGFRTETESVEVRHGETSRLRIALSRT